MGAKLAHPIQAARGLARTLRVNGLPGFLDFMRSPTFNASRYVDDDVLRDIERRMAEKGVLGFSPRQGGRDAGT